MRYCAVHTTQISWKIAIVQIRLFGRRALGSRYVSSFKMHYVRWEIQFARFVMKKNSICHEIWANLHFVAEIVCSRVIWLIWFHLQNTTRQECYWFDSSRVRRHFRSFLIWGAFFACFQLVMSLNVGSVKYPRRPLYLDEWISPRKWLAYVCASIPTCCGIGVPLFIAIRK